MNNEKDKIGNNTKRLDRAYAEWAPTYDEFAETYNIAVKKVHPVISRMIEGEPKGGIGLDLGCGTGLVTHIASQHAKEVIGIDRSKEMLIQARKKESLGAKLDFQLGDITQKLDFPDNHFDFVVSVLVLSHIEDVEPIYKEVYRVLKPGGAFIFDEPDSGPRTPEQLEHKPRPKVLDPLLKYHDQGVKTWYSRPCEQITQKLQTSGFTIEEIVETKYDDELKDMIVNLEYHRGNVLSRIIKARKKITGF